MKLQYLLVLFWLWVELTALGVAALGALALFNPAKTQPIVLIALAVYLAVMVLILGAVRYCLRRSPQWVATKCPTCNGLLYRSHRRPVSRLVSLFVPLRRYYCVNPRCRWQGLRMKPLAKNQELTMRPLSKSR